MLFEGLPIIRRLFDQHKVILHICGAPPSMSPGIWYHDIPERTYVWVANRDNPIGSGLSGKLVLTNSSDLVLSDSKGRILWRTANNVTAGGDGGLWRCCSRGGTLPSSCRISRRYGRAMITRLTPSSPASSYGRTTRPTQLCASLLGRVLKTHPPGNSSSVVTPARASRSSPGAGQASTGAADCGTVQKPRTRTDTCGPRTSMMGRPSTRRTTLATAPPGDHTGSWTTQAT
uniref:non-specific serine/threonine protein kinase n=1 Tax=Aegilops tauschii subsp. strangulata TaxID=200361 RepID=A0A453DBK5_AEGTS